MSPKGKHNKYIPISYFVHVIVIDVISLLVCRFAHLISIQLENGMGVSLHHILVHVVPVNINISLKYDENKIIYQNYIKKNLLE